MSPFQVVICTNSCLQYIKTRAQKYHQLQYIKTRGQNKVGPLANCPHNLVKAYKMLRPRAQMLLKMLTHFHTWCIENIKKKNQKQTNKHLKDPQFSNARGLNGPWKLLAYIWLRRRMSPSQLLKKCSNHNYPNNKNWNMFIHKKSNDACRFVT